MKREIKERKKLKSNERNFFSLLENFLTIFTKLVAALKFVSNSKCFSQVFPLVVV